MQENSQAHVSSSALLELKGLLATTAQPIASSIVGAQHRSSSSGDADANLIMVQPSPGRVVFSTREAAAVATGSSTQDDLPAGADVKRTSEQTALLQRSASGDSR
jgi:hypothetical protein